MSSGTETRKRKSPEPVDSVDAIIENLTRVVFWGDQANQVNAKNCARGSFLRFSESGELDRVRTLSIYPYNGAKCDYSSSSSAGVTVLSTPDYFERHSKSFYSRSSYRLSVTRPYGTPEQRRISSVETRDFADLVENHLRPLVRSLLAERYLYCWNRYRNIFDLSYDHHFKFCLEKIKLKPPPDFVTRDLFEQDILESHGLHDASDRLSERKTVAREAFENSKRRRCAQQVQDPHDLWVTRSITRAIQIFLGNDLVVFVKLSGPMSGCVHSAIFCSRQANWSWMAIRPQPGFPDSQAALDLLGFQETDLAINSEKYDDNRDQILHDTFARFLNNGYAALYPERHPLSRPSSIHVKQIKALAAQRTEQWRFCLDDSNTEFKPK